MTEKRRKELTEEQIEEEARKIGQLIEELRAALEESSISYDDLMKAIPEAPKPTYEQHYGKDARRRFSR